MDIRVENKNYPVVQQFVVLHEAWECDSEGWIVYDNKEYKLVLTNHGCKYFANYEELVERINFYEQVLKDSKDAVDLLKGEK